MRKYIANISWLSLGQFIQMCVSATIGIMVARYLGPNLFGKMNYVMAFVGLFMVVVPLGLPSILVRAIIQEPTNQKLILGVAISMQAVSSFVVYFFLLLVVFLLNPSEPYTLALVSVYGITILAKPLAVYRAWFESKIQIKRIVIIEITVLIFASLAKLVAISAGSELWTFLTIQTLAVCSTSIGVYVAYAHANGDRASPMWNGQLAGELFSQSWPLIVSAIGLVLYLKIDQVMLGQIAGTAELGVYSAALRLSEVWYTAALIMTSTFFPAFILSYRDNRVVFARQISVLLEAYIAISFFIAVIVTLFSGRLIEFLYGSSFAGAGTVLVVHVWAGIFIFIGTITGKWYLLVGIQRLNIMRNFLGAGANIVLNFVMIPIWGAWGAAVATLVSYAAANYFADALSVRARPLFWQKTRAFMLWPRIIWRPRSRLAQLRTNRA